MWGEGGWKGVPHENAGRTDCTRPLRSLCGLLPGHAVLGVACLTVVRLGGWLGSLQDVSPVHGGSDMSDFSA